jgi:hypothetical protein
MFLMKNRGVKIFFISTFREKRIKSNACLNSEIIHIFCPHAVDI